MMDAGRYHRILGLTILRINTVEQTNLMKIHFILSFLVLLSIIAHGDDGYSIASDNFDSYASGDITGQGTIGVGWTSGWTGSGMPYIQRATAPVPIDYQIPNRGSVASQGGCLTLTTSPEPTNGEKSVQRSFTPVQADLFVGFTFQISTIGSGTDTIHADILDSNGAIIRTLSIKPSMNTAYPGWYGNVTSTSSSLSPLPSGSSSTVYFALIEIRRKSNYYDPSVWINPADFYQRSSAGASTTNNNFLNSIRFRVSSSDSIGPYTTVRIDNLRIGLTWDSVVPPLPSTAEFPNFSFESAHRLQWYGDSTKKYRVESSTDMVTWTPLTSYTDGANKNMELFVPLQGSERFFRVTSSPR